MHTIIRKEEKSRTRKMNVLLTYNPISKHIYRLSGQGMTSKVDGPTSFGRKMIQREEDQEEDSGPNPEQDGIMKRGSPANIFLQLNSDSSFKQFIDTQISGLSSVSCPWSTFLAPAKNITAEPVKQALSATLPTMVTPRAPSPSPPPAAPTSPRVLHNRYPASTLPPASCHRTISSDHESEALKANNTIHRTPLRGQLQHEFRDPDREKRFLNSRIVYQESKK